MQCIQNAVQLSYRDSPAGERVDTPERWDAIQRGLDKLRNWAHVNLIQFNKTKCWWCTRVKATLVSLQAGDEQTESSPAE